MLILLGGATAILAERLINIKRTKRHAVTGQTQHYLESIARVTGAHVRLISDDTGRITPITPLINDNLHWETLSAQVSEFDRSGITDYADAMDHQGKEVYYSWKDPVGRTKHYKDVFYRNFTTPDMYCLTLDVTEEVSKRNRLNETLDNAATLTRQLQTRNIEVNQLLESVERLSAEKDEINSVGREDVQFLLSTIASAVDYSCTTGDMTPEVTRLVRTSLEDITYTIDDMNWIASNRVMQAPIQTRNINIPVMLRSLYKQHNINAKTKGIKFFFDIDQESEKVIRMDFLRIRTILDHLIRNAIQHSNASSIKLKYHTYIEDGEMNAGFIVEDNGNGIPVKIQNEMFERFKISGRSKHANVGLWECKQLADTAQGEMDYDAEYINGARFVVKLPVQPPILSEPSGLQMTDLRGEHVMIVTQSDAMNHVLAKKFEYMGATTECHTKIRTALATDHNPTIVVSDYVLNTDSLKNAVERLEAAFPNAGTIILENDFEAIMLKRPMLPQPYTFDGIIHALESVKRHKTVRRVV